jgi:hypothetical protein
LSEVEVSERDVTMVVLAFLGMAIAIGLLVFNVIFFVSQAHRADLVYNGVCTYRQNLVQQVSDTERYLSTHPAGAPSLGISAAQLQSTVDREKAAADSLAGLNCPSQ